MKIISFVGRHNCGKTTLLTKIIPLLKKEGINVAVVKHSAKEIHELPSDKDSDRLFNSGSDVVYFVSPKLSVYYSKDKKEKSLNDVLNSIPNNIDLVIIEGYKKEDYPKIEVIRKDIDALPIKGLTNVIAKVTDCTIDSQLPVFSFNDEDLITRFIIKWLSK
ncbi:hypothetical protein SYNTR_0504 [Candidatus Syntrophocurvum alkaliphilum]|uniref:Molybdopterin-guanine dinucleotide biosynthesis protein B (MobB) domain-containing protein n=1 Tax=Candidatus Syntrophocurvum alkaliphilum TaxID=2293317 RepID=A0A6I6D9F3_9FIRM|nr:molybdopterin-guanine dinucleotide biosynthesis protein B [Candidatus Syntrophocurvum alkaliphilum]QGT99097.1 hypothetical protein SYNTR_0504 [Candidatus Syntrophocurvum alkaliphilum]